METFIAHQVQWTTRHPDYGFYNTTETAYANACGVSAHNPAGTSDTANQLGDPTYRPLLADGDPT